jgi:hypothetical protein
MVERRDGSRKPPWIGTCILAIKIKDSEGNEHELLTKDEQTEMVTGAINRSTKKLGDDLTKRIGDSVGASLAETLSAFETKVTGLVEEKTAAPAKPKPGESLDIENHPAFKGLQKQLADSAKKIADAETATQFANAKAKDQSLRTTLQERLTKAGFDPKRVHLALGTLIDAQKRVRYGDDDSIVFKGDDNEEVDLETGLKAWSQTDDAKTYMPPRGASGSGDRPGGKAPGQSGAQKLTAADLGRSVLGMIPGMSPVQE